MKKNIADSTDKSRNILQKAFYLQGRSFLILYKIKDIPIRTPWPPKEAWGLSMLYEEADPDSQSSLLMQNLKFSVPLGRPQEMLKSKAGQRQRQFDNVYR